MSAAATIARIRHVEFRPSDGRTVERSAFVDGVYRYWLRRVWDATRGIVCWVMLNPSTADGLVDDPTVVACCAYAEAWGFGGVAIVNFFAYRATDPADLEDFAKFWGMERAVGGVDLKNDDFIRREAEGARLVVCGWGARAVRPLLAPRERQVLDLLRDRRLDAIALTAEGTPAHPLRKRRDLKPFLYRAVEGVRRCAT